MISLLSMSAHVLGTAFVLILKAFFSMFTWFLKSMSRALRLLFVALPCTCMILLFLLGAAVFSLVSGDASRFPSSITMYGDLKSWWMTEVYSLKGSTGYIFLLLLTVLMFIPVVTILLCISVIISHGSVLFIGIVLDAAVYFVRLIFGKGFVAQAMGRYYRLFPEAGRRHDERYHDQLLRKRNRELEKELEESRRSRKGRDFYGHYEDDLADSDPEEYDYIDNKNTHREAIRQKGLFAGIFGGDDFEEPYYEDDEDEFSDGSDGRYIEDEHHRRRHSFFHSYEDYDEDEADEADEYDDEDYEDIDDDIDDEDYDSDYDSADYDDVEIEDGHYGSSGRFSSGRRSFAGGRESAGNRSYAYGKAYSGNHSSTGSRASDNRSSSGGRASDNRSSSGGSASDNRSSSGDRAFGAAAAKPGSFDFFAGCNSRESADRKYKSLVKLYHPDNMDGDTAALQEINAQYAEVKKRFG